MSDQLRQSWVNAWRRAVKEQLIPYRLDGTAWQVKRYTVAIVGPAWHALCCNCAAGRNGHVCKHCAVVVMARRAGVYPIYGTARVAE